MLEAGRDAWFDTSKVLESARFTREELPKRLARRLLDLQLLPYIVVNNPHISHVYQSYRHTFDILRDYPPPQNMAENEKFSSLLRRLVDEHAPMLDALATGLREIKRKPLVGPHLHLDSFLEAMLSSRISRRVLAEHHINLHNRRPGYVGIISTDLSLSDSIDFAAGRSKQVCIETYGVAPEILISGDLHLKVPYIPAHLDYMLYELLKNASRAVVERHFRRKSYLKENSSSSSSSSVGEGYGDGFNFSSFNQISTSDIRFPPIHVRICGGTDEVTLRISDQGGGIPFHLLKKVWEFGWTDLDDAVAEQGSRNGDNSGEDGKYRKKREMSYIKGLDLDHETGLRREGLGLDNTLPLDANADAAIDFNPSSPAASGRFRMAGLGFGLPLSRLYARYFGGDLRIVSMPSYGVDAFLYLKGLGVGIEGNRDWAEQGFGSTHAEDSDASVDDIPIGSDGGTSVLRDEEGIGALRVSPSGMHIF
jgi:[3-methyl-2-oxobutanoate dehydrogenase (acetyl-transferring)] kinase